MTTPNDRSPAPKLSAKDKELSAQRSDDLARLHKHITAAVKKIRSSSTYHPPRAAETVAILGLWPKKTQRPALLEVIPRGTSALPLRMTLRHRALRQQIDNNWVEVRLGEWNEETDRLITVPRAEEAWATMLLAGNIACEVFEMECWSGPELDRHGLRIDFSDILADIGTTMLQSAEIALELGELPDEDGTTETEHARDMIGRQLRALDTVRDAVQAQIIALLTYRDRLAAVDRQTEAVRRAEQARSVSDRTADLLGLVGSAEMSEDELNHASRSVAELAEARSLALAEVRGDYLNALAP